MRRLLCSDLYGSFEAQGWMEKLHVWGWLVITICTLKKEVVAFGGTLAWLGDELPPPPTWMLGFGGLNAMYLTHDVTWGLML